MECINLKSIAGIFYKKVCEAYPYDEGNPTLEECEIAESLHEAFYNIIAQYTLIEDENINELEEDADVGYEATVGTVSEFKQKKAIVEKFDATRGKWSWNTFRKKYPSVHYPSDIARWRQQVDVGGSKTLIWEEIESFTMTKFRQAREDLQAVHDIDLKRWALVKSSEYPGFNFKASKTWLFNFKKKYNITSRKVQKIVSIKSMLNLDTLNIIIQNFREEIKLLLPDFNPLYVLNTDQVGFNYELTSSRTLSHKNERRTCLSVNSKNKCTHSYTVQYIISLSGDILPQVYVCLQEVNGSFGPLVWKNIFKSSNVYVDCTSSGKLTRRKVEIFLKEVVKPYLKEDTLYILDKFSGQKDSNLYENLVDGLKVVLKFIPENTTDVLQPLDVYFHRQLKFLAKSFFAYEQLHHFDRESILNSRNGILKMHSLIHFLLSAPIFKSMVQYCFYSSGIWNGAETPEAVNVKSVCFNFKNGAKCTFNECKLAVFIACSWCKLNFCFEHFFIDYHMTSCSSFGCEVNHEATNC